MTEQATNPISTGGSVSENLTMRDYFAAKARVGFLMLAEISYAIADVMLYASEFPLDDEGYPKKGDIHANIRAMKQRVAVLEAALRDVLEGCRVFADAFVIAVGDKSPFARHSLALQDAALMSAREALAGHQEAPAEPAYDDTVPPIYETLNSIGQSARIVELERALRDLVEAADSMRATYGFVQGETPEDDDTCLHEMWAEVFLMERADAARAALAGHQEAPAEPRNEDAAKFVARSFEVGLKQAVEEYKPAEPAPGLTMAEFESIWNEIFPMPMDIDFRVKFCAIIAAHEAKRLA